MYGSHLDDGVIDPPLMTFIQWQWQKINGIQLTQNLQRSAILVINIVLLRVHIGYKRLECVFIDRQFMVNVHISICSMATVCTASAIAEPVTEADSFGSLFANSWVVYRKEKWQKRQSTKSHVCINIF